MKNQNFTRRFAALLTAAMFFALVLPKTSWAAVPSTAQPGLIMKGLEEEGRAPSNLEEVVTIPEEEAGRNLSTKKEFVLKSVVLDGSTTYKSADLTSIYEDMIGQKVSFADLNKIAQKITRKYREDGYIFSRAVLPPQNVAGGVVHLRAVEGRITAVQVVGDFHDNNGLIKEFADKIRAEGVANTKEIERYLLLINDLPGITAKSFVKPSATAGGGTLVIDVKEKSLEGDVAFDNRGSRTIGPYRGTLVGAFNDVLGLHDRTTLRGILATQPRELSFADITHEEQIGSEGAKVKARAAFTNSDPGGNLTGQNIKGDSQMYDLEADYPLLRGRQHNLNLLGGLNVLDSTTDVLGAQVANDRVRSVRAGAHYDFTDSLEGVTQFDALATQGLDILGATSDGLGRSRASGKQEFLKGDLAVTRVQALPDLFSLMLSGMGQVSRDPLLASEQFAVGGPAFGRAYDSGEIAGDTGYAGVAELRYGGPVDQGFLKSYQLYTFIDGGRIYRKVPAIGEQSSDSLTSAGLGVRFNLVEDISGYLEVDKPLTRVVASEGNKDTRVFFSLLKRF